MKMVTLEPSRSSVRCDFMTFLVMSSDTRCACAVQKQQQAEGVASTLTTEPGAHTLMPLLRHSARSPTCKPLDQAWEGNATKRRRKLIKLSTPWVVQVLISTIDGPILVRLLTLIARCPMFSFRLRYSKSCNHPPPNIGSSSS